MQSAKTVVAGLIIGGAGAAIRVIGDVIFTATGATTGPVVDYGALMGTASIVLFGLAGILIAAGVVTGLYGVLQSDEDEERGEEREDARSSGSRTAPSSQQGRPRNRRRS